MFGARGGMFPGRLLDSPDAHHHNISTKGELTVGVARQAEVNTKAYVPLEEEAEEDDAATIADRDVAVVHVRLDAFFMEEDFHVRIPRPSAVVSADEDEAWAGQLIGIESTQQANLPELPLRSKGERGS